MLHVIKMSNSLVKPYIFYHSHCQDGILATGVMLNFFESNERYTKPHIIPYNHGDPIDVKALKISRGFNRRSEDDKNTWVGIEVFFLDILPSYEILRNIADTNCKIHILDHHKSAIKIIKEILTEKKGITSRDVDEKTGLVTESTIQIPKYQNIISHFSLEHSGCGIAWNFAKKYSTGKYFINDNNPLVEFVQDRDIWKHNFKESNWVLSYLATTRRAINPSAYAREFRLWSNNQGDELTPIHSVDKKRTIYVNEYVRECIEKGKEIFEVYQEECERIAKSHVVKTLRHPLREFRVAVTECSGKYASAVGDILARLPGVDFSVSYENVTEGNGGNTQCRGIVMNLDNKDPYIYLRARARFDCNDVDLSEIIRYWDAEGSTGGGHEKAAGSTSTMNKFITSFC